jgi:hypothetical protein
MMEELGGGSWEEIYLKRVMEGRAGLMPQMNEKLILEIRSLISWQPGGWSW